MHGATHFADISAGEATTKTAHDGIGGFEKAMKEIVRGQLKTGVVGIKDVANLLDVSTRAFQRTLKEYELTFSDFWNKQGWKQPGNY